MLCCHSPGLHKLLYHLVRVTARQRLPKLLELLNYSHRVIRLLWSRLRAAGLSAELLQHRVCHK